MTRITIYDTTLRDGAQGEGISLSVADKLKIATKLDWLGVDYVEGGWPGSNPKDAEFFRQARTRTWDHAKITAFSSTRRPGIAVERDPTMVALLEAGTEWVTLFGKSWTLHVEEVLETTRGENLAMIAESVSYLRGKGRGVFYDAEHFFDGFKADREYALATITAARDAGAVCIILCDTNGGTLTDDMVAIVDRARDALGQDVPLGIHTHNDCELAVANTLAAVRRGVTHVQGTINGYGERCGNANLCSIIPTLQLKMGYEALPPERLSALTEVAHAVAETANMTLHNAAPYVGHSAFAHKGGVHVSAMRKVATSYQHIDPALVGNQQRVLVSELSGRGNVLAKAEEAHAAGSAVSESQARTLVQRIKVLESDGYQFEGADGSFQLLIRRMDPDYRPPFELIDFLSLVERRAGAGLISEATVKIRVGEEVIHTAGAGNGPVNALDAAVRKVLIDFYPALRDVHLLDYKVRVVDGASGTAAITRVLIETGDGRDSWTTVGSSPNIIEASWLALADSLEYAIIRG
jgi:2-isopropylmalate synthase